MRKLLCSVPVPFWCYFVPMLAAAFGLIPHSHPFYSFLSRQLLPICLVLLLIGTDLKSMARMGLQATGMMLCGSAGTVIGGLGSYGLYRRWLPPEAWGGIGALAGSWTGGSANMIAVKEALQVPDSVIGPLIIVDAGVAYSWMALLIWSSSLQDKWDAWMGHSGRAALARGGRLRTASDSPARNRSLFVRPRSSASPDQTSKEADTLPARPLGVHSRPPLRGAWPDRVLAVSLAIFISLFAQWVAQRLPVLGAAFSASTWTVLIVTTAALLLSLTPLRRLEEAGASRAGTLALYLLLASIGARADLKAILQAPAYLALGLTWILIHGAILLLAGWFARAPLGLIAAASQANIGGPVSAPIVGGTFSPRMAGLGLLMAVFGNVIGTYLGLATALAARNLL